MVGDLPDADRPRIYDAASAKAHIIGVEYLVIRCGVRHAHAVMLARDRRKITQYDDFPTLFIGTAEYDDIARMIVVRQPIKAVP